MHGLQEGAGRILVAALLSAVVGLERQWRGHPAGLRTHMLLGVGAALAAIAGRYGFADLPAAPAPDRIAAQVVSGVGFLGAGAILKQRSGIHGLTTAATLWAVAIIGLATGMGLWAIAGFTTLVLMLTLFPIGLIEGVLQPQPTALTVLLHIDPGDPGDAGQPGGADGGGVPLARLEQIAVAAGCRVEGVRRTRLGGEGGSRVTLDLEASAQLSLSALLEAYAALPGVVDVAVQRGAGETRG